MVHSMVAAIVLSYKSYLNLNLVLYIDRVYKLKSTT
jgi:hypothetical protein